MILGVTFSKPCKECEDILGRPYIKIRIVRDKSSSLTSPAERFFAEFFTEKQAFQKTMDAAEVDSFIKEHAGKTFRNAVVRSDTEETTYMANRHGEVKVITKRLSAPSLSMKSSENRRKNYILAEGKPIDFLVETGVMTKDGKVIDKKYDKFRQINRFLEFVRDIIPDVKTLCTGEKGFTKERPLHIADFGCGKSYLTFAVYYYLTEIEHIPVEITGLDLKKDVIEHCQKLASSLGYDNLHFYIGDVAEFKYSSSPDVMITLHACDTATDYALNYAVSHNACAVLSVPCCQHEINLQLQKQKKEDEDPFASFTRWGIIQERFAALATDALRAELLEQHGYNVQVLEFIDMENTPKNLLIRAVRKASASSKNPSDKAVLQSEKRSSLLLKNLDVRQTLDDILKE